ncbi:DNA/RNA polymerase [Obba rivulosa]|uniref:DNA polymerase kappa n=1 Tax=Obba rivulosa TaxID=1052685 RepID=A0A8E2AM49_9APHY|nr:DNA/RNA polymerase [Obba rivulosa]
MPSDSLPLKPSQDSESLLRRLAGPSTTKAGLAKDQSEINRIIAEASKGSKFYENEKKKDKETGERIARILKHRDEVLRGVDLQKVEQAVDQILAKMEAQRDLSQTIVHVDMDAFYASVELLDNPELEGKPFAVGHGVLTTASYEARKYGVRSGMASFIAAKLCPDLILVKNNFQRYSEVSKKVMDIFRRYDAAMCAAGCDEGYLNITPYCTEHHMTAEECVQEIRAVVHRETHLTVSAGIAPNKMLAKICSDKNKPNGQFKLEFSSQAIKEFMKDLSIRKVPGVGRVNERLLESIGIRTCGDIYTHRGVLSLMDKEFGLHFLLQTYLGIASNVVQPYQREERKSIGAERTFSTLWKQEDILQKLEEVAAELEADMQEGGWAGKTVTLKYKLDTYQVFTRAKSFDRWICAKREDLIAIGKELLMPELPLRVRLIGLRVTKLKDMRKDAEKKAAGIKRFFESVSGPASPSKKRRVQVDADEKNHDLLSLSQDGYEEAMPGYHDHAEDDENLDKHSAEDPDFDPDLESHARAPNPLRMRPPVSAPASTSNTSVKPMSSRSTKPSSARSGAAGICAIKDPPTVPLQASSSRPTAEQAPAQSDDVVGTQTCPICGKELETDNRGFNAHIDFCLSRGAILEAQTSASVSTKKFTVTNGSPARKKRKSGKGAGRR